MLLAVGDSLWDGGIIPRCPRGVYHRRRPLMVSLSKRLPEPAAEESIQAEAGLLDALLSI